jgi:hypothetical protein
MPILLTSNEITLSLNGSFLTVNCTVCISALAIKLVLSVRIFGHQMKDGGTNGGTNDILKNQSLLSGQNPNKINCLATGGGSVL